MSQNRSLVCFFAGSLAETLEAGARAERERTSWARFCEVVEEVADEPGRAARDASGGL